MSPNLQIATKRLRNEFLEKNTLLENSYRQLSPLDFNQFIFKDVDSPRLYILENNTYKTARDCDELLQIGMFRSDLFIPMADFFGNCFKKVTLKSLYAFVVDLDHVSPNALRDLIKYSLAPSNLAPTLILNSGKGVQLYYCLDKPLECYRRRLETISAIYDALLKRYQIRGRKFKVDHLNVMQPYRLCGSQTKLGDVATGFESGPVYNVKTLAETLDVALPKHWKEGACMELAKKTSQEPKQKAKIEYLPNGRETFFYHCVNRCFAMTVEGNRYDSLFATAIVGYKCRIPRSVVLEALQDLRNAWNRENPSSPVQAVEVDRAMRGYTHKYMLSKASRLEEWFGWEFDRRIKRNGRSQADHLKLARAAKDKKKAEEAKELMESYLTRNPRATKAAMARDLQYNRRTIAKYYPEVMEKVCITTGMNHPLRSK